MNIVPQLIVHSFITGSLYALASSGLSLTYGILRILNFAHGQLMMVGAYLFYFLIFDLHFDFGLSAIATAVGLILVSFVTLQLFVLPFSKYSFFLPFVTTLALATILESLVSLQFGVNVRSLSTGEARESLEFFGVFITPLEIVIILSAVILLGVLAFIIHATSFGRRVRAISEFDSAAESLGINRKAVVFGVFTISVLLAGYAGILEGYNTNLQPAMGGSYTIKAFAAMVLGGLGNLWGTVAGSFILGFIENFSIGLDFGGYSLPAGYRDAFAFVIILLVLLFRPRGLFRAPVRAA